ncbi:hypothetical protein NL108_004822 [Boleophthalmus pectinirostris]|nr:hypothetical protein NL108_004822 [Boleophthalmus pectinirostris]
MNITGNLKNKDCTTMFHNLNQNHDDKYYFRVQNSGFNATAVCDFLQITVRDSPWSPTIKVSGKQTETEVVTITCSAVTPCPLTPPLLTWNLHQDTANLTETNTDRTVTNITKITQSITVTDAHDGLVIKCNASYPVSGGFKMSHSNFTLSVSYGPKNTSVVVSPAGPLSAGQSVTLSCSSRANPPVHHVTWFRHNSQGAVSVSQGHTYTFNITEEGQYYCVASNTLGHESSPDITLSITGALPWGAILGAVVGVLMLICLCLFVWCFKKRQSPKDKNIQAQSTEEETIHYGELDFSHVTPKHVPSAEEEETVYSQVQGSKPVETSGQDEDDSQSLYANVKKVNSEQSYSAQN